jgi:hypothetical protein
LVKMGNYARTVKQSYLNGGLGLRVERPAAAQGVVGTRAIFTIRGQVAITLLEGFCVTQVAGGGATTLQLRLAGVAGNVNLGSAACASQNIGVGSFLRFPDAAAAQPIVWVASDVAPIANYTHTGLVAYIATTGTIDIVVAAADNLTGSIRWTCFYIPISEAGRVTLA